MSLSFPPGVEGLTFISDHGTIYIYESGAWRVVESAPVPNTAVLAGPGIEVSNVDHNYTVSTYVDVIGGAGITVSEDDYKFTVSTELANLLNYQGRIDLTDETTIPDTTTLNDGDSFVNSVQGTIATDWNDIIIQDITEDVKPLDVVTWNEIEAKFDYFIARDELLPNLQEVTDVGSHTTNGVTLGGADAANAKIQLNADGNATFVGNVSAVDFLSTSDISLKENITVVDDALTLVKEIEGVRFDWKETGKSTLGVVAQNVETVLPELVTENNGTKSVNYNGLVGLLIEAVKEQQKQIDELKSIISYK